MQFLTTTDGVRQIVEADSAQQAAQIAERDSEGAAQVICVDRIDDGPWPFPRGRVDFNAAPVFALVGEAEF